MCHVGEASPLSLPPEDSHCLIILTPPAAPLPLRSLPPFAPLSLRSLPPFDPQCTARGPIHWAACAYCSAHGLATPQPSLAQPSSPSQPPTRCLRCPQDYLEVFKGFTLTVCGLGMDSTRLYAYDDFGAGSSSCAPEAVAS